jgi:hypothetical protein
MEKLAQLISAMLTVLAAPVMAGTFDGDRVGQIPPSGRCHAVALSRIVMRAGSI